MGSFPQKRRTGSGRWEVVVGRRGAGEWMLGGSGQTFREQRGTWVKARAHQTCWKLSWVAGEAGDGRPVNPAQWSGVLESGLPPHWSYCCAVLGATMAGLEWGSVGLSRKHPTVGWMAHE